MGKRKITVLSLVLSLFLGWQVSYSQDNETAADSLAKVKAEREKKLQKHRNDSLREAYTNYKPILGLGPGFFNYFGELNHNKRVNPLVSSYGAKLFVSRNLNPSFSLDFNFLMGNIAVSHRGEEQHHNFKSQIISGSVYATYNFAGLQRPDRILNPYLSVGVGSFSFDTKGDLKDANGNTYHYWSDGSIRSLPQNDPLAETAVHLERDYEYETDLREANLDGLGDYPQVVFSVPVGAGFNMRVSDRMNVKLGSTFYYTFTDLIDNFSSEGVGVRQGDEAYDHFLFTSFSIHYDFFSQKEEKITRYSDIDFTDIVPEDSDQDGIKDKKDKCPDNPQGVAVDDDGCPLDDDGDGIPNYADEEPNSPSGMPVNENGVAMSDEMIQEQYTDTTGTNRKKMFDIYPSMKELYEEDRKKQSAGTPNREVPDAEFFDRSRFHLIDTNGDNYLSVDEVAALIDRFFDGESGFTVKEIYQIIDYMFEQ